MTTFNARADMPATVTVEEAIAYYAMIMATLNPSSTVTVEEAIAYYAMIMATLNPTNALFLEGRGVEAVAQCHPLHTVQGVCLYYKGFIPMKANYSSLLVYPWQQVGQMLPSTEVPIGYKFTANGTVQATL